MATTKWERYKNKFYMEPFPEEPVESYTDVPSELNMILVGKTGSGKSATGNTLVGSNTFKESSSFSSQTKTIAPVVCKFDSKTINIVDTPGLFDTEKDFTNEEMVLEVVKTAIKFHAGIHLFLFVMKSDVRFTEEEEQVVKDLEKILSKDLHNYIVVILTKAQPTFGKKTKPGLKEFIRNEKMTNGTFGNLINKVKDRVVAIENDFYDDDYEKEIAHLQRQSFLRYLMYVISKNKGRAYSNRVFVEIKKMKEQDELARQQRIEREQQLSRMKHLVEEYLIKTYLQSLTASNLQNTLNVLESRIEDIKAKAKVKDLNLVSNDDINTFFKTFVQKHDVFISNLSEKKSREMEVERNNIGSAWLILLNDESTENLKSLQMCIREKRFKNAEVLFKKYARNLSKRDDIQDSSENVQVKLQSYCKINCDFLRDHISSIIDARLKLQESEENFRKEEQKNEALKKISDVIDEKLESYLSGKTLDQLKSIESSVKAKKVPADLLDTVKTELSKDEIRLLSDHAIKKEILQQISIQSDRIEKFKKKASSCFPSGTVIQTKANGCKCISSVQVNDEILVFDANGHVFYDTVYMISHANASEEVLYVKLSTKSGKVLFISPDHLLPIDTLSTTKPARDACIGDNIFSISHGNLAQDTVMSISYEKCMGAFCPMTMNGHIVVNGIAASCYTTFVDPTFAHTLLCPFRIMFKYTPTSFFKIMVPYDSEEGMPLVLKFSRFLVMSIRNFLKHLK